MFKLVLKNETIDLKWGTWAMREFCKQNNITIDKYFELLSKTQFDLDLLVQLVHVGYKSACVSNKQEIKYTDNDVCEWIDEIGSIFSVDGVLANYIKYIVDSTLVSVSGKTEDDKKKDLAA